MHVIEEMRISFEEHIKLGKIDLECIDLCRSLNALRGIATTESCCGHDKTEYSIWFIANKIENVPPATLFFCQGLSDCKSWKVELITPVNWKQCIEHDMLPISFHISGPIGDYRSSEKIAKLIKNYKDSNFTKIEFKKINSYSVFSDY